MIGLALVTLVAVLAAGITTSFRGAVNDIWKNADYAITAQNNFSPIPPTAADAAAKNPIVEAVGNVRTGEVGAFGKKLFATAVNPPSSTMFHLNWITGSQATMATLGSRRRVRRQELRQVAQAGRRLAGPGDVRRRAAKDVQGQGHLRSARRRLAVRDE